jgi:regulator of protease activity HflC (stomatin/prohibitin superfamily)
MNLSPKAFQFISTFERLVVFRMGKAQKVYGPGTVLVLPCVDKVVKVDVRTNTLQIPTLQVISADKGIVEMETVAFVRINDPLSAVCTLDEHEKVGIIFFQYNPSLSRSSATSPTRLSTTV